MWFVEGPRSNEFCPVNEIRGTGFWKRFHRYMIRNRLSKQTSYLYRLPIRVLIKKIFFRTRSWNQFR